MKTIILDIIFTLMLFNAQGAVGQPKDESLSDESLSSAWREIVPIYDTEQVSKEEASVTGIAIQHLAADLYFCNVPCGADVLEEILREAAAAAGATALTFSHHKFEPDGVSAVLILGESHISVHYWYEKHYALVDVVTCGACNPYAAIDVLKLKFKADSMIIRDLIRPFKK